MVDKITPKKLQETKDQYIILDVREADIFQPFVF